MLCEQRKLVEVVMTNDGKRRGTPGGGSLVSALGVPATPALGRQEWQMTARRAEAR
jgi:hypothetical protein